MQLSKTSLLLVTAGLITGVGSAVALQAFAQQVPTTTTPIQTQTSVNAVNPQNAAQPDTDNIQDPNDKEQPDAVDSKKPDTDNIQDPGGVEVPDAPSLTGKAVKSDDDANKKDDHGEKEDGVNDHGAGDKEGTGE